MSSFSNPKESGYPFTPYDLSKYVSAYLGYGVFFSLIREMERKAGLETHLHPVEDQNAPDSGSRPVEVW